MTSSNAPTVLSHSYIDEYIGNRLEGTAIAFIILETAFVVLRQWSRRLQKAPLGWDDVLIIPAYLFCLSECICGILDVRHGSVGHHIDAVKETAPENIEYWGRISLIAIPVLYAPAVTFPKLVILAIYLRIFVDKPSRLVCYIVAIITILACVVNIPLSIWQCSPPAFAWDKTIEGGYCAVNVQSHIRWGSFPNIVTDLVMLIVPLPVIWRLHTSSRIKAGLTITFLVGSVGLVASILRFAEFFSTNAFDDGTWASINLVIWVCVEPGIYFIAACLLALPTLLSTLYKNAGLSSLRSRFRKSRSYTFHSGSTHRVSHAAHGTNRRPASVLGDDTIALQAWSGGDRSAAEISAERGECSRPISLSNS